VHDFFESPLRYRFFTEFPVTQPTMSRNGRQLKALTPTGNQHPFLTNVRCLMAGALLPSCHLSQASNHTVQYELMQCMCQFCLRLRAHLVTAPENILSMMRAEIATTTTAHM